VSLINLMVHPFCDPDVMVQIFPSLSEAKLARIIDAIFAGLIGTSFVGQQPFSAPRLEIIASR